MKKLAPAFLAVLALSPLLAACGQGGGPGFDSKVRAYLLAHPEVIEEAMTKLDEKRAAQALVNARAAVDKHRTAIERDPRDYVANPDGRVTVTEFFDYRCGYCKAAAPQIVKLVSENPDVRFVFKEMPIFGGVSNQAAATALAAGSASAYLSLYQRFFAIQALDEASIDNAVAQVGLNPAEVKTKAGSPEIQRHLLDTHALAGALGINGTPTFIVGDEVIAGADLPALKAAIAEARKKAA